MQDIIRKEIERFTASRPSGRGTRTTWGKPLTGFADAGDPLFEHLRTVVRPTHATPRELLDNAGTVVSYFIPFEEHTVRSNRKGYHASKEWAVAYVETNALIIDLNKHLSDVLEHHGFQAVGPLPTHNFDKEQLMSDWSHKHVAYIAGLGKFGTHHLLITDKGCCGRFGSIITDAVIPPTARPDIEYCLDRAGIDCGQCLKRCPVGALEEEGFDRHRCHSLLQENARIYEREGIADVCGKCSTMVPCSFRNPVRK